MRHWWILILAALLLPCARTGAAQKEGGLLLVRGTTGARLRVDGRDAGSLPIGEVRLPPGPHEIRLSRWGFEEAKEEIWVHGARGETRVIYLHQKRRRDAFWRGLLLPGWGSYYEEHTRRGGIYAAAEAGVLLYALHQEMRFRGRRDDYDDAARRYAESVADEAIAEARVARDDAYDEMASAEANRDGALLAAAAVYGISVLDAFLGFPFGEIERDGSITLLPAPAAGGTGAAVALRFSF